MTDHTANDIVDSRTRMLPPLAIFGAACFLFAGAIKFHVKGGDIWFVRPMGAPVTCLFLALVGWASARWFFGMRPASLPTKVLAALVVMLPLMGLLGVVQAATAGGVEDRTPLGGTLGAMLAGPRAFGSLGTTVAGILFAILALFGGYLARRIVIPAAPARADDPYAALKAMSAKRGSVTESEHVAAIEDELPSAPRAVRGELFPADVELEPKPIAVATEEEPEPSPMLEARGREREIKAPVRASILSGLVDIAERDDAEAAPTAAPYFAAALRKTEQEARHEAVATLTLDEEKATSEPEEPPKAQPRFLRLPALDPDEDAIAEVDTDDEVDEEIEAEAKAPATEEPDMMVEMAGGESPELAPEWLAAPRAFHGPRAIAEEIAANEALYDILDVTAQEPAPRAEDETSEAATTEPEPEAVAERPRFRVKADFVRDEPEEEPATPMIEEPELPHLVRAEAVEAEEAPSFARFEAVEEEAPSFARAEAVEEEAPSFTRLEVDTEPVVSEPTSREVPVVEAQLVLPAMPETSPAETADDAASDSSRPRRRMRSVKKDWASWDEAPKERPRLRLVKSDEPQADQAERAATSGDDTYDRAVAVVVREDRCSVSLLQRNMGVTFGDATALIDRMYQQGVVGPYQPTGRRDVLLGKKGAAAEES